MENLVFVSMPIQDLQTLIIDCVSSCLKYHDPNIGRIAPILPDLGGIDLAVEVTGLAKPTIYAAVQRREIPHMKKGKKLYFKRSELQAWIESGRKPTTADIESVADRLQIGKGKKKGRNNG
jgi:excisionase family DNA binding protein